MAENHRVKKLILSREACMYDDQLFIVFWLLLQNDLEAAVALVALMGRCGDDRKA